MTGSLLFLWTIWGRVDTFFVSKLSVAYSDLYFQVEVPVMMSLYLHLILNTKVLCATSIFKEMKLYFFFCLKQFTYTQNLFLIAKLRCCKNSEFESFDAWCMLFFMCLHTAKASFWLQNFVSSSRLESFLCLTYVGCLDLDIYGLLNLRSVHFLT